MNSETNMSKQIDTGGHAFPCGFSENGNSADQCGGLTIRDYFAAKALSWAQHGFDRLPGSAALLAKDCYTIADAMLAARKTGGAS